MKQLELTPRLKTIADLVCNGARLADIGTDHAYLPVWLLLNDRLKSAIAADIRPGPLDRARATAEEYDCTDRMRFVLCDGLSGLNREDADTIVIAGMGGETIAAIMQAASWLKERPYKLLLQPMSTQEQLRGWLWRNNFRICQEYLVAEGEKLYNIFSVVPGEARAMSVAEEWAGCQYPDLDQPLRGQYLQRLIAKIDRAADGVRQSCSDDKREKLQHLEQLLSDLRNMKKEWDEWQR